MAWLADFRTTIGADNHKTSPIVWFQDGNKYLGGRDDTLAWCRSILSAAEAPAASAPNVNEWNADHGFEYDLVVIGGGSGGLACSKEAQKLGAKVAVLDYVKPSPAGSKWGLGGTCVNVGCIPKKLMHHAAILGDAAKDAKGYGWSNLDAGKHDWATLRQNVQDHIKGLNFSYRVQLREAGVTYFNKLGKFTGPHTMELTDAKGKTQTITGARFIIATGGRPTLLPIPGGELAITSDDIFMKETAPGKTCVVGAGYISLECAGFLTAMNQGEVTVLCRSVPLRTFDRDVVNYIQDYMQHHGTKIITGVLPKSIEKLPNGRLLVSYGDTSEEFDTVLEAVGRTPDLTGLNLTALNEGDDSKPILQSPLGKLVCQNEQTSVPHVYAIGDVVEGAPELTPVAILAGRLLARRLFGGSTETIVYKDIATAVFTPLEMGEYCCSAFDCGLFLHYRIRFGACLCCRMRSRTCVSRFARVVLCMRCVRDHVRERDRSRSSLLSGRLNTVSVPHHFCFPFPLSQVRWA
jgi:thioredoxin/glutathione reductase (selenoprotein)